MALKLNGTNSVAAPAFTGDDADTGLQCGTNELKLVTGGTARLTVDSSGNVDIAGGLEVTESGTDKALRLRYPGDSANTARTAFELTASVAGVETAVSSINGGGGAYFAQSVGIGTSSVSNTRLHVSAAENTSDPMATDASIVIANTQNAGSNEAAALKFNVGNTNSASISAHYDSFNAGVNSSLRFYTQYQSGFNSPAERMRITSNGVVLVGKTSASHTTVGVELKNNGGGNGNAVVTNSNLCIRVNRTGSNGEVIQMMKAGTIVGRISVTASATSYNTSSDYRLKENVVDLDGAIDRVKQLAPKRFNFIADAGTTVDGFLAHEAQTVVPEAITGTHNGVEVWEEGEELPDGVSVGDNKLDEDGNTIPDYQGIDQSKLVPLLTAALQEAIAKIETLETKVAALEAAS